MTGASFLKIDSGARPAALGGAYTAIADDVNTLTYNPGGLARLSGRELGATHTQWLMDSQFDFLGYAQPTRLGTFGLGVTRLANGNTEVRDANRQVAGGFNATDTAYALGFGRTLRSDGSLPNSLSFLEDGSTSLGMNAKLLRSTIGSYSASALAFDAGATYQFRGRPLSLGVSVLNMGPGMRFLSQTDPLPLTVSLGAAYRMAGLLHLSLDVRREVYDQSTDVGVGTEYAVFSSVMLRAGYASRPAQTAGTGASPLSGVSGGLGLRFRNYRADYTFTPFGDLGNAQRISLGARF